MRKIIQKLRQEAVLVIAALLAVFSAVLIPPDASYAGYIDFRTLAILFSLMTVMAGLRRQGVFDRVGHTLLNRTGSTAGLLFVLVGLCFFSSMLITNDVSLITFVPFTFIVLHGLGEAAFRSLVIPVVCMQTIAANLGSMLTPIGNPQNLYLYGKSGMRMVAFLVLMLPYTILSLCLLVVWILILCRKVSRAEISREEDVRILSPRNKNSAQNISPDEDSAQNLSSDENFMENSSNKKDSRRVCSQAEKNSANFHRILMYAALFLLCLLTVLRILPYPVTLCAVFAAVFLTDRRTLRQVDYSLLLTFIAFFIFIGNLGRIPAFSGWLQSIISGQEVPVAVLASQVTSNVPAALLLSGFTENLQALIIGTNLGGLGTLIASMASLISYRQIVNELPERKGAYFIAFTVSNFLFLAILMGAWILIR